jgi:hypothetical protein
MIYILVCEGGEYDDKYSYNIGASSDKEKIEALKKKKEEDVEKLISFKEKLQNFSHEFIGKYDLNSFNVKRFTKKQLEDPDFKKKKKEIEEQNAKHRQNFYANLSKAEMAYAKEIGVFEIIEEQRNFSYTLNNSIDEIFSIEEFEEI